MKTITGFIIVNLFFTLHLSAQTGYDRNKLIAFYQDQEYGRAIEYLLPFDATAPDRVQFYNDLGYSYFMNEQPDEALRAFMTVYQLQPSNTLANLYAAQIWAGRKEADSTLFYYKNLIGYQPSNYRFWQKAGQVFNTRGNYDSARSYYQHGYQLNPRSASLVVQYCDVLLRLRDLKRADTILQRFLAIDSTNREVIAKRIDLSFRQDRHAMVIYWGEKLWKDSADVSAPYIHLAFSYLAVDSLDKCISISEWMMLMNKANQALVYCASQAYAKKKNFARSNELLDDCLKMTVQAEAVRYLNAKSDNYEAMKQYNQAVAYYDTSYYIFKTPADLYYAGRLYDKYLNNKVKARQYYQQFLDKAKAPKNSGEKIVFDYVKEYLNRKEGEQIKTNR
jgi:tetratricopeptide (TPR) repeat protein